MQPANADKTTERAKIQRPIGATIVAIAPPA